MRPEDLLELIRKKPFLPFRVHVSGGKTYDIRHPDQIIVLRSRAIVGAGTDNGFPERADHIALIHVIRIEEMSPESQED